MSSLSHSPDARRLFTRAAAMLSECTGHLEALERTLEACLPDLGDFGFFDAVVEGGDVVRVSRAHDDPEVEAILRPTRWVRQDRADMNLCALTSGRPALHPDIDDAWYRAVAANEDHLAVLRRLAFRSMVTVPMRSRGALIGALTLFMGRSGRCHGAEHFAIAEDLAGLAAPMVANAGLIERQARAEAALRHAQDRLHMSVKAAGLGPWEWSAKDGTVYWSREYRAIYGLSAELEPSFDAGMERVLEEDRQGVLDTIRQALRDGAEFHSEHRIVHPSKGLRWIEAVGRPIDDGSGMTGVVADITERREARKQVHILRDRLAEELQAMRRLQELSSRLVRREERLEDLLGEILRAALAVTDRDRGAIQLVDEDGEHLRFAARLGFGPGFPQRDRRYRRGDPAASARAWATQRRVAIADVDRDPLLAGTPILADMRADGIRSVQATPLVSRDGRVVGVLSTHGLAPRTVDEREARLLDLLARVAADFIERAQYEAMLKESDRRKDEFLAILSHELRNPLAPIRYAVSIAQAPGSSDGQRAEARAVIDRQVRHMGRLLDDLLDVSRIARGTVVLKREAVPLEGLVASAVESARPAITAQRHELRVDVHPPGLVVDADPVRLVQILTNLLNNAARYMDPGGRIDLEAGAEGGDLVLRVRDRGIGIAPEMRPRLFRLFSRASDAARRSEGGLGIGLALVHGFVSLHGGTVVAESEGPGRGSDFVVRLPGAVVEGDVPVAVRHAVPH